MMTDNAHRYNIFAAVCTMVFSFVFAMLVYLGGVRPFGYDLIAYGVLYALPFSLMAGGGYSGCASSRGRQTVRLPVYVIMVIALLTMVADGARLFGRPLGLAVFMSLLFALLLGVGVGTAAYWGVQSLPNLDDSDEDMDAPEASESQAEDNDAPCCADFTAVVKVYDVFIYVGTALLLMFLSLSFYHFSGWHTDIFTVNAVEPSDEVVVPDESEPEIVEIFATRYNCLLGSAANMDESERIDERDRLLCELVCGVVNADRKAEIDRQAEIVDSLAALGVYISNDTIRLYHMDGAAEGGIRYTDVIAAHDTIADSLLLGGGFAHSDVDLSRNCPILPHQGWTSCVGGFDGAGIRLYYTNGANCALVDTWLYVGADAANGKVSRSPAIADSSCGVYHEYQDYIYVSDIDGFAPEYEYNGNVVAVFAEYSGYENFHGSASLQYFHTGGNALRLQISAPVDARSFEITTTSTADSYMLSGGDIRF